MAAKVNLTKKITTPTGKRWCPVMVADNGRVKPDWVIVAGKPEKHTEGRYYIDWNQDGKRHRQAVGSSASHAVARQLRKETELKAIEQGISVIPQDELDRRLKIADAIATYLEEIKLSKKHRTFLAYSKDLEYFQESCSKVYIEQIERIDMLRYGAFLQEEKGLASRTASNKFKNVMTFLRSVGKSGFLNKNDCPKYVEEEPEIYEKEDLDRFFKVCYPHERLWFRFFLMSGMREQEVMHIMCHNVKFKQGTVEMRWKPEYNWSPKGYKEREIPVPAELMEDLAAVQPPAGQRRLLFPTSGGKPKSHFLDCCKAVAKRAGLNPDDWWLHKFRSTFATLHLQNGVDLATVQKWMGHKDLASTMRYLRAARGAGVQAKVNTTFA